VARLVGLGAIVVADPPEHPWVVLADPEGNEFCVLPRKE
jgi:Glyoxalase-like domain